MALLELSRRLSGAEARFLRKAALGIAQEELASRFGITRVTVARWETRRSLSAEQDYELRAHVAAELLELGKRGMAPWKSRRTALLELLTSILRAARTKAAPAALRPLRLAAQRCTGRQCRGPFFSGQSVWISRSTPRRTPPSPS